MNESIKQLLALQDRDLELDRLRSQLAAIPGEIAGQKHQIDQLKIDLEHSKKELTQLQLLRKEKEVDLDSKETAIRKLSAELNALKSNDAYRAMIGEIDKAKQDKSVLEDAILQVMEQIDQAQRAWKQTEATFKTAESEKLKQISELEAKQTELEQTLTQKTAERNDVSAALPKKLSDHYERLRKGIRGAAVVPLKGEQCSGCHMRVSQNLINEVRRGQVLMACESCSRIVYLAEVAAA